MKHVCRVCGEDSRSTNAKSFRLTRIFVLNPQNKCRKQIYSVLSFIENVKRLNLSNPSWSIRRNIMSGQEVSGQDKSKAPPEAPNCMEDSQSALKHSLSSSETNQLASNAHQQAQDYLRKHKIYELTNFLISHLLVDEPDDPIEYLGYLLEKCMLFKHGLGNPPLIFTDRHINGIFSSFVQGQSDAITLDQYREAMKLLGISQYDENPPECTSGYIDKETFSTEAKRCLSDALADIVSKFTDG